jgi:inosine-uridine nucleoside N-ribohydrolase
VVTWDAALKMAHAEAEIRALDLGEGKAGKLVLDMHQCPFAYLEEVYGKRVATFPDPLTMAYVVDPSIARDNLQGDLQIQPTYSPRRGATVLREGQRVRLITEIDKAGFQSILLNVRNLA